MRVTSKNVKDFWAYMAKKYDFSVVDKGSSTEMALAGWWLEQMEIQSKEDFLEKYSTTLCLGEFRRVYIPFEIGKGTQAQLIQQVITCTHESQHVVQSDRDVLHSVRYATSDAYRTQAEVDAYRVNMELYWHFYGKLIKPTTLANMLKGYGVGKADIRVAAKHLTIAAKVVERGGVITGASKVAIRWLEKHLDNPRVRKLDFVGLKV